MITSVRNLTRTFLSCSYNTQADESATRQSDREDTERVVKFLIACLFATKNHLRAGWGAFPGNYTPTMGYEVQNPEYNDMVPPGLVDYDHKGLGIPLQFLMFVEMYIKKGGERNWWNAAQGSQLTVQTNMLVDAYGRMETIRLTPIPVAHL